MAQLYLQSVFLDGIHFMLWLKLTRRDTAHRQQRVFLGNMQIDFVVSFLAITYARGVAAPLNAAYKMVRVGGDVVYSSLIVSSRPTYANSKALLRHTIISHVGVGDKALHKHTTNHDFVLCSDLRTSSAFISRTPRAS